MIIKNKGGSLAKQAYDVIRKRIYDNDIKPGELISENIIAEELGISRTPVREAIRMLASEEIVESRDGIGTIVRILSFKEIRDIFEVRKALEAIAAKTAIYNVDESEIIELLNEYAEIGYRYQAGDVIYKEFAEIDMRVHNLIISNCDNNYVKSLFEGIGLKIKLYQFSTYTSFDSNAESISQHMELLNLLKNKELDKLVIAINKHLDWSLHWYLEALI